MPGIPDSYKALWDRWTEKAKSARAAARLANLIQHYPAGKLYDLETDPYELHNVADRPTMQEILTEVRGQLRRWMASQHDPSFKK